MNSFTIALIGVLVVVAVTARPQGLNINNLICLRSGDIVEYTNGDYFESCVCKPTNQTFLGIKILRWNCTMTLNTTTTTTMVPTMAPTTGLPVAPTTVAPAP